MSRKILSIIAVISLFAYISALVGQFFLPIEIGRGKTFNYQTLSIIISIIIFLFIALLVWLLLSIQVKSGLRSSIINRIIQTVDIHYRKYLRVFFVVSYLFFEFFLLSYVSFPVPLRPVLLVSGLNCLIIWIILRFVYREKIKLQEKFSKRILRGYKNWNRNQRISFFSLLIIAFIAFCIFIPINLPKEDNLLQRGIHPDEQIIYPDSAVKILTTGDTFGDTARNIITGPYWWYGYPFHTISAIPLIIPRLILGNNFSERISLNLFLLRQFVSVLPMLIALVIFVYQVTKFNQPYFSIPLFLFMLSIPGIVYNNIRFWHPDALILLFTLLTIFFVKEDNFKYGKNFYYAAITISLSASIKLFGLFFVFMIGGYLIVGFVRKVLPLRKILIAGLYFLLLMALVFIMFNPDWLVPWIAQRNIESIVDQQVKIFHGFEGKNEPEEYQTGLSNWLYFVDLYYMNQITFIICIFTLVLGSLIGSSKYLNRLIFAWCVPGIVFLIFFSALKSHQYMMPFFPVLYISLYSLPTILESNYHYLKPKVSKYLRFSLTIFVLGVFIYQFILNVLILINTIPVESLSL